MRKLALLLICVFILGTIMTACDSTSADIADDRSRDYDREKSELPLVESNTKFAFDIFKRLNEEDMEENIFISPLSISQALTMAYNGAEGSTREAMEQALAITGLDRDAINSDFSSLSYQLEKLDKKIELYIGNSIWIREGSEINESFIKVNKKAFNAEVRTLDFSDIKSVDIINDWIDSATKGRITDMLKPPINPDTLMYLINAIYFKGEWSKQFNSKMTYQDNFYALNGEIQTANMMRKPHDSVEFTDGGTYKAVRLPYGKGKTSMYIILPAEGTDINEFISNMTLDNWRDIKKSVSERDDIILRIPRFKLEYGTRSLKDSLSLLGMGKAFSPDADFSGIRKDVTISDVLHRAVIEVNEEGSEAAAITAVDVAGTAAMVEPITFIANRPFIFIINDDVTDTILFMGKVVGIME